MKKELHSEDFFDNKSDFKSEFGNVKPEFGNVKSEFGSVKPEFSSNANTKSEFRSPENIGSNPLSSVASPSPNTSTPQSLSSNMSFNTSNNPPRPPSTDMSNVVRGMKRPSDEPHDGNPPKQVCLLMIFVL